MEITRARILVITGNGKGKTTAATGLALRALGNGLRVLFTRFCKSTASGEIAMLRCFSEITILSGDRGMTPPTTHPAFPAHAEAAQSLFRQTVEFAPDYAMIILDEVCGATARGLLDEEMVIEFITTLRGDQFAVLTGRDAGSGLVANADTVSVISECKHGYQAGIRAQPGVEY